MTFTRFTAIFTIYAVSTTASVALHADTLQDIYALAQQNNPQIRAAKATYQASNENRKRARSSLLPSIGLSGNLTRRDTTNDTTPSTGSALSEQAVKSYTATLNQPLFNMPAWFGYKQVKATVSQSELDYTIAQQDLILRTTTAYFEVLRALDNLEATKAEEIAIASRFKQTKQRYEVGLLAITSVQETRAAYDAVAARLYNAIGLVEINFENLRILTGRNHINITPLKSDFPISIPTPENAEQWAIIAAKNNLELQQAALIEKAAGYNHSVKKWNRAPTVALNLSHTKSDIEITKDAFTTTGLGDKQNSISVNFNMPLFRGGSLNAEARQARYQHLAATESFNNRHLQTLQNTRSQYLRVRTDVAAVKARQQALKSSTSAYEATKSGYDVGTRNLVDLLNSEQTLFQARRNFSSARYDYIINGLKLSRLGGILSENNIVNIQAWLDPAQKTSKDIIAQSQPEDPEG